MSPVRAPCSYCPIFLRTLSGRTFVMDLADCSTCKLLQRIEVVTRIPQQNIGTAMSMGHLCPKAVLHMGCIETALSSCVLG